MACYKTNIEVEEQQDLGLSIQKLIESNIKNAYTSYLAQITAINGNKVHIKPIIKTNPSDKEVVVNNVLVAFPFSQNWRVQFKLKVGDIGLAAVNDKDLTCYKNSGGAGNAHTQRYKNISDAIFFPAAMFQTKENQSVNFTIENEKGNCCLTFGNDEIGLLKAKLLTIQSENTTLKTVLKDLATRLENMAKGNTAPDGHGHSSTTAPSSIGKFNEWAANLDRLFKA